MDGRRRTDPVAGEGRAIGRAAFLGTLAAGIGGIAALSPFARQVQSAVEKVSAVVPVVNQFAPTTGWRVYTVAATMPSFDPATYTLSVTGMVENPMTLSWREFDALPSALQRRNFHCVTGWTVSGVHWQGVLGRDIVRMVKPLPQATHVSFVSMEVPYVDQLTVSQFSLPDVMLAKSQDGAPLLQEHGAPLRLVIPEMYGYKNVKWVKQVHFGTKLAGGYWEQRGYDVDAWVGRSNGYS